MASPWQSLSKPLRPKALTGTLNRKVSKVPPQNRRLLHPKALKPSENTLTLALNPQAYYKHEDPNPIHSPETPKQHTEALYPSIGQQPQLDLTT